MDAPDADAGDAPPRIRSRPHAARSTAQYRAFRHPADPRRLLHDRRAVLRHARQSREHSAAGVDHGDHRGRPHLRHPHRRDRPQRRRDRQRDRDRVDLFHDAARLRQYRQYSPARLAGDPPGARGLLRARPRHRLRRDQDRHPFVHHDAGDDADRRRRLGGSGARADRLFRAAAGAHARLEIDRGRSLDHHRRRAAAAGRRISC